MALYLHLSEVFVNLTRWPSNTAGSYIAKGVTGSVGPAALESVVSACIGSARRLAEAGVGRDAEMHDARSESSTPVARSLLAPSSHSLSLPVPPAIHR